MNKVLIKILQGGVVMQTVLGGLTVYLLVANFLWYIMPKTIKFGWQLRNYCNSKKDALWLEVREGH